MSDEIQSRQRIQRAKPTGYQEAPAQAAEIPALNEPAMSRIEDLIAQGIDVGSSGDFQRALVLFSESLQMSRRSGAVPLVVRSMDQLAAAHWELGEHSKIGGGTQGWPRST